MKTVNYRKTTDMKNLKSIREYQEKIAKMVSNTCDEFAKSVGFDLSTYGNHIYVEKYLLADITIYGNYESKTGNMTFDSKASWSDVTKSYRVEIIYNKDNVFVANISMEEAESIKEVNNYTSYNRQSEFAKEFVNVVNGWLANL